MATITSPRAQSPASTPRIKSPSIAETPASSTRGSFETSRATGSTAVPARRNRAALRDYYNLKSKPQAQLQGYGQLSRTASIASTTSETSTAQSTVTLTDNASTTSALTARLDDNEFDTEEYVSNLLEKSSLREILKVEATLVSEIRNLDGERKALVYDNYSKLIKAVGTIADMQRSMNEDGKGLTEVGKLQNQMEGLRTTVREVAGTEDYESSEKREARRSITEQKRQKRLVSWVIDAPERLRKMLDEARRDDAEKEWTIIKGYLTNWNGVRGVPELREKCEAIMASSKNEEDGTVGADG